jgi:hypothetical protein
MPPTCALRPVNPNNACPLRITAAAGTELAGASSGGTVKPKGLLTPRHSSHLTGVYNPKAFIPHAASLGQACAHCPKFPTAASRRSLGRVSVPMWPITLSGRLPIEALVGRYPANKLIGRGSIQKRQVPKDPHLSPIRLAPERTHAVLPPVSRSYPPLLGRLPTRYSPVRRSCTPEGALPLDLHVLGTPPAFILSQDQTLQLKTVIVVSRR